MTTRRKHSPLWVYLLYLGLVTSLILSMTLARYASTAAGAGTATVAAMAGGGELVGEPISMLLDNLSPSEARTLKFQVVNFSGGTVSEVALDYEITVSSTRNLPLRFTLTAEAPEGELENTISGGDILTDEATQSQVLTGGSFPLEGRMQAHTYTLTVTWPAEVNGAEYAHEIDLVTITVEARQRLAGDQESTSV